MTATVSRRQALLTASGLAGIAVTGLRIPSAQAKAAMPSDQAPYFYRFKHGSMQATVVSDGILPLGDPSASFLGTGNSLGPA